VEKEREEKTMKTKWMAVLWLMCGMVSWGFAAEPVVSNVMASQIPDTKLVDIYYDLVDADGDAMTVSILIHDRDVQVPASSFTGALGENIYSGTGKHIVWDAGADWNGLFSENIRVGIAASDDGTEPPPSGMVRIPHGTNTGTDPDFGGYHLVLPNDIFMGCTEVTLAQWGEVRGWANANGYNLLAGSGGGMGYPVHTVNWYDCAIWCNAKSEMEGRTPCYNLNDWSCNFNADGYRLPTDEEWEYAARGGLQDKRYPWGDPISSSDARYASGSSVVVGGYPSNDFGLRDVSGNVWEWCWNSVDSSRSLRGGSWNDAADTLRCGHRGSRIPGGSGNYGVGFRIVRKAP